MLNFSRFAGSISISINYCLFCFLGNEKHTGSDKKITRLP